MRKRVITQRVNNIILYYSNIYDGIEIKDKISMISLCKYFHLHFQTTGKIFDMASSMDHIPKPHLTNMIIKGYTIPH